MTMNLTAEAQHSNEMLFAGFNQDSGCFAVGTSNGFIIYNVDPFRETFKRIFPNGGIGIVEMLFRCNLLAIVGGGRNPRYPTNKVMIWDDHQNKCIGELKFRTEVHAVRLRRDRVVVVLESKVFVYRFKDLKLLDQITTVANPKGLVALCPEAKNNVLAVPGLNRGIIRIELYDIAKATLIKAHDADLAQFALNSDGSKIASASEKGTLIRIWNCHNGEPLRELRRGMDRAEIYCIAFNPASTFVACSSDKGTVHIYSLTGATPKAKNAHGGDSAGVDGGDRNSLIGNNGSGRAGSDLGLGGNNPSQQSYNDAMEQGSGAGTGANSNAGAGAGAQEVSTAASNKLLGGKGMTFLKGILPGSLVPKYFESEWSFAQVRGIEGRSICAFGRDASRITVVSADGSFVVASFEDGGDCSRVSTAKFLRNRDDVTPDDDAASWATAGLGTTTSATAVGEQPAGSGTGGALGYSI
jgi:WD repeat-containing protein 45